MYFIVTGGTGNFRYQGRADICATGSEAPQRFNYSTSDMGAEYCGERVCVCLSTIIPSELHVCDCLVVYIISYHTISYQKFIVHPLLREPGPWLHYKSQPNAKTPRKEKN